MIFSQFWIFISMIINVQADLIGWNRARNNEMRQTYRRVSNFNTLNLPLLDQYQQFFSNQGKAGKFLRARRWSTQAFQKREIKRF